ncbi:60S ribosomal protein L23-like [Panthera leo]|uniref:60S ribosomal protein L23-like n=1 Tax=Panthera leo TaxID=9689 RepID=UPI001C6A1A1D|nr:60S ribosomal protein L23-like [Panthera leo]XP_060460711.1 large ribosomal subunit protein uL14-like [Panthera onca]
MLKQGCGGCSGLTFEISLGLLIAAMIKCADNTGVENLSIISVKGTKGPLNRLPTADVGDTVMAMVKKGEPELRKKVHPAVVIRQRKSYWKKMACFSILKVMGLIVNNTGRNKKKNGSPITGPVAKEFVDLWPKTASNAASTA